MHFGQLLVLVLVLVLGNAVTSMPRREERRIRFVALCACSPTSPLSEPGALALGPVCLCTGSSSIPAHGRRKDKKIGATEKGGVGWAGIFAHCFSEVAMHPPQFQPLTAPSCSFSPPSFLPSFRCCQHLLPQPAAAPPPPRLPRLHHLLFRFPPPSLPCPLRSPLYDRSHAPPYCSPGHHQRLHPASL